MSVLIDCRIKGDFPAKYENVICSVVKESLSFCKASPEWEVSCSIVDCDEIRKINKQYRNIDNATDVLSFPQYDADSGFVYSQKAPCLGDIIICMEKAISQAETYGHSVERELGFLTAHSMLHLLGYDHIEDEEENIMIEKQERILVSANLLR